MSVPAIQPRRLVLVGSVLVDILLYVDTMPERGGDAIAQKSLFTSGGGFNVLIGATRLGMPVAYAGRVGDGPMGMKVMHDLAQANIPSVLPRTIGEDTGFDIGFVESDAERTFVTSPGTESRLSLSDLAAIPLQASDAVYVSGYDLCYPVSGASLGVWLPTLPEHCLLVIDPGPLVADIPSDRLSAVLARCDIVSLNEREITLLTGKGDVPEAAQQLVSRIAPNGYVIARAGADGCWIASSTLAPTRISSRPTHAVDTTGAGDTHVAAMLTYLAQGYDMQEAARVANIAGSLSVVRIGPATGPSLEDLRAGLAGDEH